MDRTNMNIINFNHLKFSPYKQQKRIQYAIALFGEGLVKKLIFFLLYLLGVERKTIAQLLGISVETFNALLGRIKNHGLPALEDRRSKTSSFLPIPTSIPLQTIQTPPPPKMTPCLYDDEQYIYVNYDPCNIIMIPKCNPIQCKTVLFTLVNSGILSNRQAADMMGISLSHISKSKGDLDKNDVPGLMDKRSGPRQDYRVTPQIQSQVIQQFFLDLVTEKKTSSQQISEKLKIRCGLTLPARTIGYHLLKLGLNKIKVSFPGLIDQLKKNSQT